MYAAARVALARHGSARVLGWVLLLVPFLGLGTALLRGWPAAAAVKFALPVLGLCWGTYFLGHPLAAWWLARSAQARAEAAGLDRTVTLDEAGVELSTTAGSARIPWGAIASIRETPGTFILTLAASRMLILPKRAMAGEAQVDQVRRMIAAEVARARGV